jgi:hypothetical protein
MNECLSYDYDTQDLHPRVQMTGLVAICTMLGFIEIKRARMHLLRTWLWPGPSLVVHVFLELRDCQDWKEAIFTA